jgi:hypothetical protein
MARGIVVYNKKHHECDLQDYTFVIAKTQPPTRRRIMSTLQASDPFARQLQMQRTSIVVRGSFPVVLRQTVPLEDGLVADRWFHRRYAEADLYPIGEDRATPANVAH